MYHAYVYYLVNSASILDIVERNLSVQGVILCLVLVFVVVDEVLEELLVEISTIRGLVNITQSLNYLRTSLMSVVCSSF